MNIGIDMDDTICNTTAPFLAYAMQFNYDKGIEVTFPLNLNLYEMQKVFGWSDELNREFIEKYHDPVIRDAHPKTLALETIQQLKQDGHTIKFITARPDFAEQISLDWLAHHQVPYDQLILGCKEKGDMCSTKEIDAFIDDAPWHCKTVADKGIKSFIVDCLWNQNVNDSRITRIYTWPQFYQEIKKLAR